MWPFNSGPKYKTIKMTPTGLWNIMLKAGISNFPMGLLNGTYYTTDDAGWANVLTSLVGGPWLYQAEITDCDWFALNACVVCRQKFKLNAIGMVIGNSPGGRHSFNLIVTPTGVHLFEPQFNLSTWGAFDLGSNGYTVDMVLI